MNVIAPATRTAGDLSVLAQPSWLKNRYDRIALISHRRHLGLLDPRDSDTLVLSTDWLAWRACLDGGIHCLHFETLLEEWPAERGDPDDIHLRRCDWMLRDGRDLTLFRGVSLGKLFVRDVALSCNAFERVWHALDRAFRRFQPAESVFHDLRAEHDLLDESVRVWLVRELATRHEVRLIEKPDFPPSGDPGFSERIDGFGAPESEALAPRLLREIYAEVADAASRVRGRVTPRGKVLLILNWAAARNLIRGHHGSGLAPALLAGQTPKNLTMFRAWWRDGVALVNPPPALLDAADRAALKGIHSALAERWQTPGDTVETARWLFVRNRILNSGWLERRALEVKRFQGLFRRHRFARVVVGDATNGFSRLVAECARTAGVPTDELPNGMFVTRQRYDARLGDSSAPAVIRRVLSWGPLTERWLTATGARVIRATVGYPALEDLRRAVAEPRFGKALVLPIYADADDAMAFTSNIFGSLVDIVRALRDFGCAEIRVKVHVGPQNRDYYADVLRDSGLDVPIFKDNAFAEHLRWADFVVGPVNSGAFVETLAAGKPYFPICPSPSQIDPALLPQVRLVRSAGDLIDRLRLRDVPDRDMVLEDMCSFVSIPDASRRFWSVLGGQA